MRTCSAPSSASEYTATVESPMRRAVRMMRQAISPRLAIRIFLNTVWQPSAPQAPNNARSRRRPGSIVVTAWAADEWVPACAGNWGKREGASQRDVVVLFPRIFELLAAQHVEGA